MTILWAAKSLLDRPNHPRADEALEAASYILWSLSGRQYTGVRRVTEAYSTRAVLGRGSDIYPMYLGGKKFTNTGGACACSGCGVMHRLRLRGTPVRRIIDVFVDGVRLQPDEYVILDHGVLGFLTSVACCADCVQVTYLYGSLPPGGEAAAARLANELLASSDGEDCSLPQRVTSVSRQGVSWTVLDPQEFINDRRTGIYEIDLMLASINPAKALAKPRVFSVDAPRAETWTQLPPTPAALVEEGDQVLILGHSSTWIVTDGALRKMVESGTSIRTRIGDIIRRYPWKTVYNSPDAVTLSLTPEDTERVRDGDTWAALADDDSVLATGRIRVI